MLDIRDLSTGSGFDKYNSRKRLPAETRYGLKSAWLLIRQRPAVTVLSNVPVVSLLIIQAAAFASRTRTVLWLQDLQSGLAAVWRTG
ncbi:MAG: hypothetical protein GY926_00655 [bacterium]|nr:hypothetical protein [bacterium]